MSAYSLKTHLKAFQWEIIGVGMLIAILLFISPVSAFSGSGAGSSGDPYQITTPAQWLEISNSLGSTYTLMNDISFASTTYAPIVDFTGTVNGQNKTVSHVTITAAMASTEGLAMFDTINGATFKNLHLDDISISGSDSSNYKSTGFLAGRGRADGVNTFDNIYITNSLNSYDSSAPAQLNKGALLGKEDGAANVYTYVFAVNVTLTHMSGTDGSQNYGGGLTGYNGYPPTPFTQCFVSATQDSRSLPIGYNIGSGNTIYYDSTRSNHAATDSEIGLTTANCANKASFTHWNSATFGILNGYPVMNCFGIQPPALSTLTANTAPNNATYSISVTGTGFQAGLNGALIKNGSSSIYGTSVNVDTPTHFSANLPLTGVTTGTFTFSVTNPDGQRSNSLPFYVTAGSPVFSSIKPSGGMNSSTLNGVVIRGSYFLSGATVTLTKSGQSPISGTSVNVVSGTQINCHLPITGAANGYWNVIITNPDAQTGTGTNAFNVVVGSAPVSDFTADHTIVHTLDDIQFNDLSSNFPYSWDWNFGDGTSHSSVENPIRSYSAPGTYSVTLSTSNYYGTGTTTKTAYITVSNLSVASMTLTPSSVLPDGSVMFGNDVAVIINTGEVTQFSYSGSKYAIDSWSLNITKPQPGTAIHFPDDIAGIGLNTSTYYLDPIICAVAPPSDMDTLGWSAYVGYNLNAHNASIPLHPSLQATNSILTTWIPANVTSVPVSAVLGQALTFHYHRNSYKGLLRTINGTMAFASTYPNPPVRWAADGASLTLTGDDISFGYGTGAITAPTIFRGNITAYGSIATPYYYAVAIDPIVSPEFYWRNGGGNIITTASNTDTVTFGLDVHNYGETYGNIYNAAIDANMYFYNTATKTWDLITTTPNPADYQESPAIPDVTKFYNHQVWLSKEVRLYGHFTPSTVGQYKMVFNTTGGIGFYTSPVLTVNANLLNPVNVANGAGGIFGIGGSNPGDASLLVGIFIMAIIAIVAFLVSRFSVYGLIAGLIIGLLVSYALGLFPVWMILVVIALSIGGVAIVFLFGRSNDSGGSGGAAV